MKPVPLLDLKAQFAPLREEINQAIHEVVEAQAFVLGRDFRIRDNGVFR